MFTERSLPLVRTEPNSTKPST